MTGVNQLHCMRSDVSVTARDLLRLPRVSDLIHFFSSSKQRCKEIKHESRVRDCTKIILQGKGCQLPTDHIQ